MSEQGTLTQLCYLTKCTNHYVRLDGSWCVSGQNADPAHIFAWTMREAQAAQQAAFSERPGIGYPSQEQAAAAPAFAALSASAAQVRRASYVTPTVSRLYNLLSRQKCMCCKVERHKLPNRGRCRGLIWPSQGNGEQATPLSLGHASSSL